MVDVNILCINDGWSHTFHVESFPLMTVKSLKDLCVLSHPALFTKGRQIFVFNGSVIPSDDIRMGDVVDFQAESVDLVTMVVNEDVGNFLCFDPQSVQSAKQLLPNTLRASKDEKHFDLGDTIDWETLVRSIPDVNMGGSQPATSETDGANSPPPDVAAPAPQAAGAAPLAPNLPVVDWLQWGVIARLVVVAFVFTYNRNMTTEKMTIMAVIYTLSYFFQIGAFGYWFALACHKLGLNLNRPHPVRPAAAAAPPGEAGAQGDGVVDPAAGAGVGAVRPAGGAVAGPAPPVAAQPQPIAGPVGFLQSLITLHHSGLTIPTAPGLLMDVVSLFMGMFLSIVPGWVPYRLH